MTDHYMATCPACGWGEGGFWTMAEANEAQAAHVCPPVERDQLRADLTTAQARVAALEAMLKRTLGPDSAGYHYRDCFAGRNGNDRCSCGWRDFQTDARALLNPTPT